LFVPFLLGLKIFLPDAAGVGEVRRVKKFFLFPKKNFSFFFFKDPKTKNKKPKKSTGKNTLGTKRGQERGKRQKKK
jgi:hypothetical protein